MGRSRWPGTGPLTGIRLTRRQDRLRSPFDAPRQDGQVLIHERFVEVRQPGDEIGGYGHWLWCSLEPGMRVQVCAWPETYLGGAPRWAASRDYRWRVEKILRVNVKLVHDGPDVDTTPRRCRRPGGRIVAHVRPCYLRKAEED